MAYESLSDLEVELTDLGAADVFSSLEQTFATDLSRGSDEPIMDDPIDFLPIEPAGESRKTITRHVAAELEFEVFPNPSTGRFEISFDEAFQGEVEAILIDLTGKTVHTQKLNGGSNTVLDLNQLQPGLYNLILRQGASLMGSHKVEIMR